MKIKAMALMLAAASVFGTAAFADGFTAVRHEDTNNVYVKGQVDDINGGDVTVSAISDGTVLYAEQVTPDAYGNFVSKFKYTGSLSDISVAYGGEKLSGTTSETTDDKLSAKAHITDEYGTAFITVKNEAELPVYTFTKNVNGTEYNHTYQSEFKAAAVKNQVAKITVNNIYGDYGDGFKIIVGAYDADGKMLMVKTADKAVEYGHGGETYTKSYEVETTLPDKTKVLKAFCMDKAGIKPLCEYAVNDLEPITLFAVGDSTCQPYETNWFPQAGWGEYIGDYFKSEYVTVKNCGHGGATTTSFLNGTNGNWEKEVYNYINPGDWVIISLGINDSYHVTAQQYAANLKTMVSQARSKGAEVIISTPIRDASTITPSLRMQEILKAAEQAAFEANVTFLDLYGETEKENPDVEEIRKKFTMNYGTLTTSVEDGGFGFTADEAAKHGSSYISTGRSDNQHINIRGANYYSNLMTRLLLNSDCDLKYYVKYTK